jgi:putative ABC transport system substrate-binding protein
MTSRRTFVASGLALAAAPFCLRAQDKPAARVFAIGVLDPAPLAANEANIAEFRKGLKELGYEEGRNLRIEYRGGDARAERYRALAAELVRAKVDLIVTSGTPATLAAKSVALPVVTATVLDPVDTGLVASLEHPGANVTGLAVVTSEIEAKRMELLRALAPATKRVAAFMDMGNPAIVFAWHAIEAAAPALGLEMRLYDVRRPKKLARAFDAAAAQKVDAFVLRVGGLTDADRKSVAALAARHRWPAIFTVRQWVDAGGLMSYGVNTSHMYNRAAAFADKVLKGARPAELPMERPSKYELVINRKTARALDLVIPPDLLLRSDEVVG